MSWKLMFTQTSTWVVNPALFIFVKTWEQTMCPSEGKWIKKTAAHPDNGILFTGRKTWTLEPWKGMEESKGTLLSKRSHSQKAMYLLYDTAAAAAKSLQSCPTLCDPVNGSPPGSPVPGILQARTLEWVVISFSKVWKWKVEVKSLSRVWLLATPWTAAYQAPPSMGFSRQEYWSGLPLPSPTVRY